MIVGTAKRVWKCKYDKARSVRQEWLSAHTFLGLHGDKLYCNPCSVEANAYCYLYSKLDTVKKHAVSTQHTKAVGKHKTAVFAGPVSNSTLADVDRRSALSAGHAKEKLMRVLFYCLKKGRPISE